jgi:iron complex outermembrane receptor protein
MLTPRVPAPLAVAALCGAVVAGTATAAEAPAGKRAFNLPRGDAAVTLKQFAAAAGTPIVYLVDRVRGVTTNAVSGELAPRDALERMLAGSALEAAQDAATGALVVSRKRTAEAAPKKGDDGPFSDPQPKPTPKTQPMKSPRTFLAAFAGWLAASTAVEAQSPAPAGEVVKLSAFEVSGQAPNRYQASEATSGGRLRTAIFDSPQTINVVTDALLKDVGATRILDALKYIPGVTESTIPNGLDRITVRGFQTDGAIVDGFNFDANQGNLDPILIERIEVVKGPNAILSPTGSPGGTINNVTKKPLFVAARHSVKAEYGAFDAGAVEIDSTGRIGDAKSKFAYRLVGAVRDYDNYWGNTKVQRQVLAPSLSWQVGPSSKLTVQADYSNSLSGLYLGIPIDPSSSPTTTARLLAGVSPTAAAYADDQWRRDRRAIYRAFFTSDLTEHLSVRVAVRQAYLYFATTQLNFSAINGEGGARDPRTGLWTPGFIYGPGPTFTPSPAPVPSRSFNRGGTISEVRDTRRNFQNDWVYSRTFADIKTTTSAGFAYTRRFPNGAQTVYAENITNTPLNFDAIVLGPYTNLRTLNTYNGLFELTRQYYANESLSAFNERVIISGGISRLFVRNRTEDYIPGRRWTYITNEKNTVNYGVVVKPIKAVSLFYGHSENASPVSTSLSPAGTPDFSVGSQDEIGARTRLLENRLQIGVTYFKIEQNAFSIPNPANLAVPPPNPPAPLLFSDRQAKGWELEGTFEIAKGFTLIGNYTNFTNRDPNNVPFRGTAEKSAAAWARYEFQNAELKGFNVSIGANWLDKRPGDAASGLTAASTPTNLIPNLPSFYLPARTLVDLSFGYVRGPWTYQANIDNVFDNKALMASISRTFVYAGPGINFRASATFKF